MDHLILYCRPGFESETAAEISDQAQLAGEFGYAKTQSGDGYVCYVCQQPGGAHRLIKLLAFSKMVFARQWLACGERIDELPAKDRITTLVAAAKQLPQCGELVIETADTNDAKQLATFCKKFTSPCAAAFRRAGVLTQRRTSKLPRLHLFFQDSSSAYMGISYPENSSPNPMGIMRLKYPSKAPSRSTLKLEEAWHTFLSLKDREHLLEPGMTAVDLGAAPGGWTWQLVKKHIRVTAVDNGPMEQSLMDSGLVTHVREDGFAYRPNKTVDWMVCDIADQPSKVARLAADWVANGGCRRAVFNLKLPMKKRYQAVVDARETIETLVTDLPGHYILDVKHLYHDREEVTCYLRPTDTV
ncbi:23S rRNA (cytidine(2498)-2'-O)-methyltransferase RlmM [Motiliproteus sp. MSK22-1]|uniref:23S rRNA (cytidine(2498)-2'-O)-methyltransferase RlmM n=1 Tax=Motiliproteus sp. MSK22-1 TaxID=1897630 RepID=UPI000977279E|nr:23S rRNA (cytidine(2498)-2'-O)-methyltransferase RlmM [Motiliproteus sp. MSK22-1]OMH38742.1 23S rRNA (cytidine(2498)-2'-O)-methyltransferase RlmM [Motiliproteus sp. MSK22-1]